MNYISVCSGIEAATVAWEPLGWKALAFSEIEPFPCKLLKEKYPSVPNLGDMTKIDWSKAPKDVDVLVGGTPCQSFSVAGLRQSLSDDRGNLALEFINAANAIRPRFIVWENVPGVLNTRDNAFGCFLGALVGASEALRHPPKRRGWPSSGVVSGPERSAAWRVLDAQYFGVPQRRKRVFVVASAGDWTRPFQVLFESEGMQRNLGPGKKKGAKGEDKHISYAVSTKWYRGYGGPSGDECYNLVQSPAWVKCECCDEFICSIHSTHAHECECPPIEDWGVDPYSSGAIRRITPLEAERLQGFPDGYTNIPGASDVARYKALGNSMAVPVMRWIGDRISKLP